MIINWYPGHMAKSRRLLIDQLRMVDVVIELCDARAPLSTRNPDLDELCQNKKRVIVLNKSDLADEVQTKSWIKYFNDRGLSAVPFMSTGGKVRDILAPIDKAVEPLVMRYKARGVNKTVRGMVIGVPNVGKSTFINRLYGSAVAKAGDRPGVTRSNQWVKVSPYLEMLDTPGLLWPKLEDQRMASVLAYLGSIRDDIMDQEHLAFGLLTMLMEKKPANTMARFKIKEEDAHKRGEELLHAACIGRGWILPGVQPDSVRGASVILDEFRGGKIGKITLESPTVKE